MPVMFSKGDKLEQGHYTVIRELGVGGMGVVYLCKDEQLMRDVAIKMLLPELMADKANLEIFRQEARLAAQLEHPNIVTVFDIKVEERFQKLYHYVCMEYLPGGNLANRVIGGPLAVEHCLNWMKQLASGLTFAHKRNVIHQDIKADNIFITTEGDLKIGDFGLARLMIGRVHYNSGTKGMGTPAYMSPELCHGEPQDNRSDIYSLGILFFEMATGQLPFRARGMIEMATKHSSAPIPSAKRINPLIPEILDKVIRRMMAKTPEDRYSNMSEVLTILDDLIFELRVARLGFGSRPLLKSGPINLDPNLQKYLAQQGQPQSEPADKSVAQGGALQSGASQIGAVPPGAVQPGANTSSANQASDGRAGSEELMAQLEKSVAKSSDAAAHFRQELKTNLPPGVQDSSSNLRDRVFGAKQPPSTVTPHQGKHLDGQPGTRAGLGSGTGAGAGVGSGTGAGAGSASGAHDLPSPLHQVWSFKAGGPFSWGSAPVIDREERVIYCTSTDGRLYALEAASGKLVWSFNSKAPILAGPLMHEDTIVVVNHNGEVAALGHGSGSVLWKKSLHKELTATPAIAKEKLLLPTSQGQVMALDVRDGEFLWQHDLHDPIVSTLQRHSNLVLVGTTHGDLYALSTLDGKIVWKFGAVGSIVAGAAASVDSVYVGTTSGTFLAVEAATGGLIWEYPTGKPIVSRAAIAFTSVIFASQDKWLYCCERYDGGLKWKAALRGHCFANLIAHKDELLSATREGWLQAFSLRTGELQWQKNCERTFESAPFILKDQLFIGTLEGEMLAYSLMSAAVAK